MESTEVKTPSANQSQNNQDAVNTTSSSEKTDTAPTNVTGPVGEEGTQNAQGEQEEIETFPIFVQTCGENKVQIKLQVTPMDNVQDIRQFLFESVDTCYITNYNLYLNGNKLNDFSELSEITDLKADSVIEMQEAFYDERSIRFHVRHLRDLLNSTQITTNISPSAFGEITKDGDSYIENERPQPEEQTGNSTTANGGEQETTPKTNASPSNSSNHKNQTTSKSQDSDNDDFSFDEPRTLLQKLSLKEYLYTSNKEGTTQNNSIQCIKSITYSGWNAPPGNRKLLGDLIYLEVATIEQPTKTFHITGWTNGFYINQTTNYSNKFDPRPSMNNQNNFYSHSLVGLLSQISTIFKKNFQSILNANIQKHPFEVLGVPYPVIPWVNDKDISNHSYDLNRAEDSILYGSSGNDSVTEFKGQLRDWNEEYQSFKELPHDTIQERIIRDRALFKFNCEFVEAAMKGAIAIVDKTVPPINPLDPEKSHMFIYNNIFFSYALDGRDLYKDCGGDRAAYNSINNDLKGIKAFNRADVKGLYTLATAIVDYRGYRICAQSIIPGILQREQISAVIYGSMDVVPTPETDANNSTATTAVTPSSKVASDPAFHELMCKVGKILGMEEHNVIDSTGNKAPICSPIESKGIVGTDGRKYILDLVRITPRDANFIGANHSFTILRPELIAAYLEFLRQKKELELANEAAKKENPENPPDLVPTDPNAPTTTTTDNNATPAPNTEAVKPGKQEVETPVTTSEAPKESESQSEPQIPPVEINVRFNPNVLCEGINQKYKLDLSEEQLKQEEEKVKEASKFLTETLIPLMIDDFSWLLSLPVDGVTLSNSMHSHGINIRYLGQVAQIAADKVPILRDLAVREMVSRSAKHILNSILRETLDFNLATVISRFLNSLLGYVTSETSISHTTTIDLLPTQTTTSTTNEATGKKSKKGKGKSQVSSNPLAHIQELLAENEKRIKNLTTENVWERVKQEVKDRFNFDLPKFEDIKQIYSGSIGSTTSASANDKENMNIITAIKCLPTLRSISQKTGIQINARDFNFLSNTPILYEDILDLYPVVKHINHESHDGRNLLEAGKSFLSQGRLDIAYELLTEALAIFHQVYGPMHEQTSNCYANLALVLFNAKDYEQAIENQIKALIINERVLGLDHHDTCHSYGNLALFYHNVGRTKLALQYIKRALYLSCLMSGLNHPDIAATYTNIAMMLQDVSLDYFNTSILYLLEALRYYETLLGPSNLQTASLYHAIALAYSQLGQFKEALSYEKKNYMVLQAKFGVNDFRTVESNIWLKQFTTKAVQAQMEFENSKTKKQKPKSEHKVSKFEQLKGIPIGKGIGVGINSTPEMGNKTIDEILTFINGKTSSTESKSFRQRNQPSKSNAAPTSTSDPTTMNGSIPAKKKPKKKEEGPTTQ